MTQMIRATVTIYTRPGCHLCDEAKVAIHGSGCDGEFSLEEVNIDEDPALGERYGNDIPVTGVTPGAAIHLKLALASDSR
jgi:glutaredoxin